MSEQAIITAAIGCPFPLSSGEDPVAGKTPLAVTGGCR